MTKSGDERREREKKKQKFKERKEPRKSPPILSSRINFERL